MKTRNLPLLSHTPDAWAEGVLRDPIALLNDHAYLEKKAASNALELLNRWPDPEPPAGWISTLSAIARDESSHLLLVCQLLQKRGGRLSRTHRNPYANALRALVRKGEGRQELADRLLVSALIEARSCERFEVLGRVAEDNELGRVYRSLWASEMNHYRVFGKLAQRVLSRAHCAERWQWLLRAEADILAEQPPGPGMHSGTPT